MPSSPPVITRFAPSPTGHLHIGGARTALFCWAYAKRHNGSFLLRIEDTDQKRSSEAASRGILEDLAWLGIDWDEGPVFKRENADGTVNTPPTTLGGNPREIGSFYQSERRDIYDTYINWLVERDLAYPAFDTPEELTVRRQLAEKEKRTFVYRRAADYNRDAVLSRMNAGEPCPIRFKMPGTPISFTDEVLGEITVSADELDDFVIRKADGFPTYHFAVVIDDELMGTTHIMRGQEHLNNTPRHIALMKALVNQTTNQPFRIPKFAHLTVIANQDNSKMSKRDRDKAARAKCRELNIKAVTDVSAKAGTKPLPHFDALPPGDFEQWLGDKTRQLETHALEDLATAIGVELPEIAVDDFRRSGYLPEAVLNYIALLGWNPGEKGPDGKDLERFDTAYLVEKFSFDRVGKSASKFDRAKLIAFNQDAIAKLTDDQFLSRWEIWATRDDRETLGRVGVSRLRLVVGAIKGRCRTLKDVRSLVSFAMIDDGAYAFNAKDVEKHLKADDGAGFETLRALAPKLQALPAFDVASIDALLDAHATQTGLGMGKIAQPLRVAVTGAAVSPPLGATLAILGRDSSLARIRRCIDAQA
ncbi:MAG: glutamate--tRNA ligase [Phycisphaeraceae bacterium]|nr:glutamate--tRNA ligase [Phycisphaeraceae bacterium]